MSLLSSRSRLVHKRFCFGFPSNRPKQRLKLGQESRDSSKTQVPMSDLISPANRQIFWLRLRHLAAAKGVPDLCMDRGVVHLFKTLSLEEMFGLKEFFCSEHLPKYAARCGPKQLPFGQALLIVCLFFFFN